MGLTEAEQRVVAVAERHPTGVTPAELARELWPDRRGQGLVIASGSMLARLERRGILVRVDGGGDDGGTKAYVLGAEKKSASAATWVDRWRREVSFDKDDILTFPQHTSGPETATRLAH